MTVQRPVRPPTEHPELAALPGSMMTATATKALAVLRVAFGFVFLWAFLDKTFGFSYATSSSKAWIHGGSPTKGFLSSVKGGPLESWFHSIAGDLWADYLFMIGLAAIGVALILGIGMRIAAIAGVALMALMWFAEYPLAKGSSNPLVDYHFIYALVFVVLAATYAGMTWGLGRYWARIHFVNKNRWLI